MKKFALMVMMIFAVSSFAEIFSYTEYLPVYKSEKIYRIITKRVPYQECWEEEVPVSESGNEGTVGALIGGVAGGILGHQIGKGSGKTAATIGGAIVGTIVGKSLAERQARPGYQIVKRCRTRYQESKERIIEYKNYATFNGQEIVKYSSTPLKEIKVRVTIEY
ncbi:glycine zipper 2TM domain-containing protein [Nitrosophilus kaiyonis]|uniref:glycine zipper 2TM domain-containing protein n=1 Tax=Nitrosophilus kaiyonis TaxID=2930200 RepID=UPI0024931D66|nr:glycine zipper 2TM domain-containing protein [Nitrosophilus kaiyonis]